MKKFHKEDNIRKDFSRREPRDTGPAINNNIQAKEMRVISDDGEQLGIVSVKDALRFAEEKSLDLVMVSPNANPPVCKLMDYGRFKYEQEKKNKEAKKKQHNSQIKELTVSYKIGEHDYQVRLKRIKKFITDGDKVKLAVRLRGREIEHSRLAVALLNRFYEESSDIAIRESAPKAEKRLIIMILAPKKEK